MTLGEIFFEDLSKFENFYQPVFLTRYKDVFMVILLLYEMKMLKMFVMDIFKAMSHFCIYYGCTNRKTDYFELERIS